MGPLGHEPPVLVNHEQTPVFGNTPALDLHAVGVHQPQGFYRCEVHGLNGDHDTPPACALPWTPWMLQHATVTASLQFIHWHYLSPTGYVGPGHGSVPRQRPHTQGVTASSE